MEYILSWLALVGVFGLGLVSPGPDFVMALRNSLIYSRRAGLLTALGFALGVLVHVTYTIFGLAAVIAKSVLAFNTIKYIGAGYLIYMGVKALRSQGFKSDAVTQKSLEREKHPKEMRGPEAIWSGFLTNLLNPKAAIFFLAIISQFISPETPFIIQGLYGLTCTLMTWGWFSIVAFVLTDRRIKNRFLKYTKWIDRLCGGVFIALGLKLALVKQA